MSQHGHHEWYVLVKIKDQEDMGATKLEQVSKEVAISVNQLPVESTHLRMLSKDGVGFDRLVRPNWTTDREVGTGREVPR